MIKCRNMVIVLMALAMCAPVAMGQISAPAGPSAARVDKAVRQGLAYLYDQQTAKGSWDTPLAKQYRGGAEALVVLAALSAGESEKTPQVKSAVDSLARLSPGTVFVRALRADVYAHLPQKDYGEKLAADVLWLVKHQEASGGWGFGPENAATPADWTDAANTQVALMALADAAEAGATVSPQVWRKAKTWWASFQNKDGGWGYDPSAPGRQALRPDSYGSMTAAAAASLRLLQARSAPLESGPPRPGRKPNPLSEPDRQALDSAFAWLDKNYDLKRVPAQPAGVSDDWVNAYLYNFLRAMALNGRCELGGRDVAREIAALLVASQQADGSWADPDADDAKGTSVVPTAYAVLCLTKARQSVALGWLSVGAAFDPQAAGNVTRALGKALGRQVAFVKLSADTVGASKAPVLLVTWDGAATLEPSLAAALARYLDGGGMILVQPLGGERKFAQAMQEFLIKNVPGLTAAKLAADHPLLTAGELPRDYKPLLGGLSDFARVRVVVAQDDQTGQWHIGRCAEGAALLANMLKYARDGEPPAGPFDVPPAAAAAKTTSTITVARVRAGLAWDKFPRAFSCIGQSLAGGMSVGVRDAGVADLAKDIPAGVDVLWLTAAGKLELGEAQRQVLTRYLKAGGTLFIDAALGDSASADEAMELARALCGKNNVADLPATDALISGDVAGGIGADVSKPEWTPAVSRQADKPDGVKLTAGKIGGRVAVIVSPYAVTCTAAGERIYGCRGLSTDDARRLACNVLLFAAKP